MFLGRYWDLSPDLVLDKPFDEGLQNLTFTIDGVVAGKHTTRENKEKDDPEPLAAKTCVFTVPLLPDSSFPFSPYF